MRTDVVGTNCPMCSTLFVTDKPELHATISCPNCGAMMMRVESAPFGTFRAAMHQLTTTAT